MTNRDQYAERLLADLRELLMSTKDAGWFCDQAITDEELLEFAAGLMRITEKDTPEEAIALGRSWRRSHDEVTKLRKEAN